MIYIAVLCNSTESLQNRSTILPLFIGPYAAATVWRFSIKAIARYQVILLGEQYNSSIVVDKQWISMQDAHWIDLGVSQSDVGAEIADVSETERKRREAVWELFRSECVFLMDHLMVLKHVSASRVICHLDAKSYYRIIC